MNKVTLYITSIFSIIAGLLHSTLVFLRNMGATPPLEAIFFFVGGVVQIGLAIFLLKSRSLKSAMALFVVNGLLAMLWITTRVFRAPFMDSPKGVGILGLFIFIFELIAMVSVGLWKWSKRHDLKELYGYSYIGVVTSVLMLSLVFSSVVYAGGRIGEKIMPNRELKHEHQFGGHALFDQNDPSHKHNHSRHTESLKSKEKNTSSTKKTKDKKSGKKKKKIKEKKPSIEKTKNHQEHSTHHSH